MCVCVVGGPIYLLVGGLAVDVVVFRYHNFWSSSIACTTSFYVSIWHKITDIKATVSFAIYHVPCSSSSVCLRIIIVELFAVEHELRHTFRHAWAVYSCAWCSVLADKIVAIKENPRNVCAMTAQCTFTAKREHHIACARFTCGNNEIVLQIAHTHTQRTAQHQHENEDKNRSTHTSRLTAKALQCEMWINNNNNLLMGNAEKP